MDIKETEDRLAHITDTIEKIGAVIESDILKMADWIKRKYQLEDALKAARQNAKEESQNEPATGAECRP